MMFVASMLAGLALASASGDATKVDWYAPVRQAEAACRAHDFASFLEAFVHSPDVRRRYDATIVRGRATGGGVPATRATSAAVGRVEITMVDYTYADEASVRRWEANGTPYVPLWIDRVALPGGGWRVDYQPAVLRDDGEGDGYTLVRKTGKRRSYIFLPRRGCWHLARQVR